MASGPASGFMFKPSKNYDGDAAGYFREYDEQLKAYKEPRENVDKSPVILVHGHEASGDDPVAPQIFEWVDLLYNNRYDYKVGYAQYFKPAYNVRSRDKVFDRSFLQAVRRGKSEIRIAYQREVGGKSWTMDGFVVYGKPQLKLVSELKKEITG